MTIITDGIWFGRRFCFMVYYRELGRRVLCITNEDRARAIGLLVVKHALDQK